MAVPIVRPTLGGDLMPREIVADIFSKAERQSVVQQIAQRQPLSSTGAVIPVVTGTPSAGWVSEAGRKPVSDMTLGSALGTVADEGKSYRVTDWVFDDTFEVRILGARDAQGNSTFLDSPTNDGGPVGRILGRPVRYTNQAATGATAQNRGFGVDASQIAYGISQDIQYDISNQASIVLADGTTVLHLWQNNLVALLAETELAFVMNDVQAAVRVADATAG
jgi:predicted phage gp36 major capsid-like protein